jgi:hypothetical protein
MALFRLTNASWAARSSNREARLRKIRARFRPLGAEPDVRAVYWKFLRATDFLTAEVAERQTR